MEQRLIDANALHGHISAVFDTLANHGQMPDKELILMCIDNAPTVDLARHGHWIESKVNGHSYFCSHCWTNFRFDPGHIPDTCGVCGAKMDE